MTPRQSKFTTASVSRYASKPLVTLASIVIAIALGLSHLPVAEKIRPIGEIYLALLQMSVLPFLLAAIPLAIRSAIAQHAAGGIFLRLVLWLCGSLVVVTVAGIVMSVMTFGLFPISAETTAAVGGVVGGASGQVDIEFIMDAELAAKSTGAVTSAAGLVSLVPSNIFAALSGNEITSVIVFAVIFGLSMAVSERRTGNSFYPELKHLHDVCLLIFEWLNILVPVGIIALIAPQIAQLGSDIFLILAGFMLLMLSAGLGLIGISIVVMAVAIGVPIRHTFSAMLKPLFLVAATRNATACVPIAVEVMTNELHVSRAGCELFVPFGFTVCRFGYILHFAASTIFIGALVGRHFGVSDMFLIGALSVLASFGTIGLGSSAGLAPLAAVLRPFALSFELALPILIVVDPIIGMVRAMLSVAVVCAITALGSGRQVEEDVLLAPQEALVPTA